MSRFNLDILILTETRGTHMATVPGQPLYQVWAHAHDHHRGIGVMTRGACSIEQTYEDILLVHYRGIKIIGVYAPAEGRALGPSFYQHLKELIQRHSPEVIMGDMNAGHEPFAHPSRVGEGNFHRLLEALGDQYTLHKHPPT
eukprot:Blabericola_migrator_1__4173@NODE_2277_length_3014_cov_43_568375_g1432_i0_p2_GENE_NODE_2277_length_3014_cov_43_568375_g1432_i0NODE_2277_length_3014_cov_43_568375_g1432_i0_p2_ORF_typecomplete_len142_score0_68Exo_endo_phos_2/PF14529_6/9_3e05Exo_endo_phos/PF03372_23/0_17_NODE_2277_length_3014_cov_43_568375_g1432_i017832208